MFFSAPKPRVIKTLVSVLAGLQLVFLFAPTPAQAQLVVTNPTSDASFNIKWSREITEQTLLSSAMGSLLNGFSYFMRKIAYDAAVYLGSAGKGQGALVYQQGGAEYFKSVGLDSVASAVDELGSPFGIKSLCNPNNPLSLEAALKLEVSIKASIRKMYYLNPEGPPEPNCKWSSIENALDTANQMTGQAAGTLVGTAQAISGFDVAAFALSNSLKIDETDIGKVFTLLADVEVKQRVALTGALADRAEGNGYKPVTDPVSKKVTTPAQLVGEEAKMLTVKSSQDNVNEQIAGLYGSNLLAVIPSAANLFINTFASQLMDTVLSGGLFSDVGGSAGGAAGPEGVLSEFAGVLNRNRELAQSALSQVFTSVPTQELSTYPILEEFNACPDNPGLNNCVADASLVKGIKAAATQPLTIREALDPKNDVLHANWPLIGPSRDIDNVLDPKSGKKCFQEKYCYSNLQKLRKARILPLGFEIAALKADPERPEAWTLEKVVNGFDDCNDKGEADENHPFCHLIDPNWLLRLPEPRCEAKVYTTSLLSNTSNLRTNECADISTCIAEDEKGQCLGAYGYCLREKNVWQIPGNSCPAQFSTCKTYTKSGTNTPVSYLSRTLNVGQCNAQSVGCRTYSVKPLVNGTWANSGQIPSPEEIRAGKNPTINFNSSIASQSCPSNMEGCSALYRVNANGSRGDVEYVKKAPTNLFDSCYLVTDPATGQKVWPQTDGEITTLSLRPEAKLCAPFAPACTKEETGCESFKPVDGGDTVTGIVGSNQCNVSCVGYDTFKQEQPVDGGAFEPEVFPLHFIPTKATQCTEAEEGCSEFTNIDKASAGGESLEYYTDLQYCERPNNNNQKTYYSWEGTVGQGYVLRTHTLRPVSSDNNDRYSEIVTTEIDLPAGSPAYSEYDLDILKQYTAECNQTTYEAGLANPYGSNVAKPNCRALYDAQGKIYYRLLEMTVSVSPACHPLRKTESFLKPAPQNIVTGELCLAKGGKWDEATKNCQVCFNGGVYQGGACVYWTTSLPGEAKSCAPAANGCRAYSGKAVNNKFTVIDQKFEPVLSEDEPLVAAKQGWSTGQIKPESITVGQYSLELNTDVASYTFATNTLGSNKFYELEFWARGNPQNLDIYLYDDGAGVGKKIVGHFTLNPVSKQVVRVPISTTWQAYRLGPVQFTGDPSRPITLVIESNGSDFYYLDNLRLSTLADKQYLLKNSWKEQRTVNGQTIFADVPAVCDAEPLDGFPGAALGCRAYTDSLGRSEYATGFDRLCRAEAVGCTAFTDSQNTLSAREATAYNVWCAGTQNTLCTVSVNVRLGAAPDSGNLGTCTVPSGQSGCYVKRVTIPTGSVLKDENITQSTVVVPADTTEPMYLSLRQQHKCESRFMGCQKVALEEQVLATSTANAGFSFATTSQITVLNNPDRYEQTLCSTSEVGCGEYKSGDAIAYFKDPVQIGNKICEYKENVSVNPTLNPTGAAVVSGWFKKDVGRCSNNTKVLCKADGDCGGGTCVEKGAVSCYDNYFASGEYGIWSNQSVAYDGFVGTCPANYSQCTELRDPADSSDSTSNSGSTFGKSYYVIFDATLKRAAAACEGKAGLKDGCVLFDQTENPTKLFDSAATYAAGAKATPKYGLVNPISGKNNDTNLLLKVKQSRQCSEWLSCKNMATVVVDGKERKVCYEYKSCRKLNGVLECGEWSGESERVTKPLNEQVYTSRDTSWYGEDYSGYSLFGKFPISSLTYVEVSSSTLNGGIPQQYAGFEMSNYNLLADLDAFSCTKKENWDTCGADGGGRCYNKKCVYPITGPFKSDTGNTQDKILEDLIGSSCKMYPEQDSPFPQSVATRNEGIISHTPATVPGEKTTRYSFTRPAAGYEGIGNTICQTPGDCSCEYRKVTYKSGVTDYWPLNQTDIPTGICTGGDKDGRACAADVDCLNRNAEGVPTGGGVCSGQSKLESRTGFRGICLEYDYSRPIVVAGQPGASYACLTWLPVSAGLTSFDPYNYKEEAGYSPFLDAKIGTIQGGEVYCRNATANAQGAVNTDYFVTISETSACPAGTSKFACNQIVYKQLFNVHGDYIGDQTSETGFKVEKVNGQDTIKAFSIVDPTVNPPFRSLIVRMNDPFNAYWIRRDNSAAEIEYSIPGGGFKKMSALYFGLPMAMGGNNPFTGGWALSVNPNTIDYKTDQLDYTKKLYSLMQMWAWHGGMYGRSLATMRSNVVNYSENLIEYAPADCSYEAIEDANPNADEEVIILLMGACANSNVTNLSNAAGIRNASVAGLKNIAPPAKDETLQVKPEITHPGAVVLFTSSLYFRDYLFTSLRYIDRNSANSGQWYVGYERRPLHEGNYLEAGQNGVKTFYKAPNTTNVVAVPASTNQVVDGNNTNNLWIKSNNRFTKGSSAIAYDPTFPNYEAQIKLYDEEISKLHFGPLLIPSYYNASGAGSDSAATFPTMLNFDFDGLRSIPYEMIKNSSTGLPYEVQYKSDPTNNTYYFRVKFNDKENKGYTRYLGVALSEKLTETDVVGFFKPLLDEMSGGARSNDSKILAWQQENSTKRSIVWIWVDFNDKGRMVSDFKKNYVAWYRDLDTKNLFYNHEFAAKDGATPYLSVVAELNPRCADYGIVHNSSALYGQQKDKAWTDRLWQYSSLTLPTNLDVTGLGYVKRNTNFPVYGSTWLSASSFTGAEEIPNSNPKASIDWVDARRKYVFWNPDYSGVMYACSASVFEPTTSGPYTETLMTVDPAWKLDVSKFYSNNARGCASLPNPNYNSETNLDVYNYVSRQLGTNNNLHQLFAAYYKVISNGNNNRVWNVGTEWDPNNDKAGTLQAAVNEKLLPPQVYSLNPASCYSSTADRSTCLVGEANNVTINRRNGTSGAAADYNNDGLPDDNGTAVIGQKGALSATMQFFGWADHNRMPISRVMIDWGDGSIVNENTKGRYQNHKPFCIPSGEESNPKIKECAKSPYLTCREDKDCPKVNGVADTCSVSAKRFGNSARACFARYFEFYHGYDCSQELIDLAAQYPTAAPYVVDFNSSQISAEQRNQLLALGYNAEKTPKVCVFQPRLQLMDNWGWCTGSCNGAGNTGCYEKKLVPGIGFVDEQCLSTKELSFIPYKGKIIVVP